MFFQKVLYGLQLTMEGFVLFSWVPTPMSIGVPLLKAPETGREARVVREGIRRDIYLGENPSPKPPRYVAHDSNMIIPRLIPNVLQTCTST